MKNLKPILITAGIALAVILAYPFVKPWLQKIPVLGSYVQ